MTIVVCPLDQAEACLRRHAPTHVVSLLSPKAAPPELDAPQVARLHLAFNDIAEPRPDLVPPGRAHIARLLDFLSGWDRRSPLLIHCWAGVSRSTAAAYIAASLRDGPGSETALAQRLRAAAPFATPNPRMVTLADTAFRRDGRMDAAIAAIGRGAEAGLGSPFTL